jgi:DNA polymerase I-like protein with 3'-5' exonuclease and polymerase domains
MVDYDVLMKILDDKVVYIKTDTEIGDFLRTSKAMLQVHGKTLRLDISLAERELKGEMQRLMLSLFNEQRTIIFWDVKPFITYMKHRSNNFEIKSKVFDLKLLEAFTGIVQKAPVTWSDAMKRTQHCTNQKSTMEVHKKIHLPLALKVIPDLETNGITNEKKQRTMFSSYEVEGQTTGRLRCTQPSALYLNPHTLDPESEEVGGLIPAPHDLFVAFDFKNMEVSVLQHLSKDEVLKVYKLKRK